MIDLHHMSRSLGISRTDLVEIVRRGPDRYKEYEIDKRAGGKRLIAQPSRELKAVQRYLSENFFSQFPISKFATAYRKGKSIRDNAQQHRKARFLLKTDFSNFFHSFAPADIDWLFATNGIVLEKSEVSFLKLSIFWRPKGSRFYTLAMGAPTSPLITNIMMHGIDERLGEFCQRNEVAYTRYADDVALSARSRDRLLEAEAVFRTIISNSERPKLKFNEDKRGIYGPGQRREVTGLIITPDGKISVGRDRKRQISAAVDHWRRGVGMADIEVERLRGLLAFCNAVEPRFIDRLRAKYGDNCIAELFDRKRMSFWSPEHLFG
ncbi:retron St85 family RNA-directed DNA polymerase [Pelagibacterium sp.]|uniref:retron St85 family RNA-directed DNA polymerase n=1 Tax=Pelagibacterium sp. TaxID=1967288 RepID=UPI003BA8430C